jgi:hypothetical protein
MISSTLVANGATVYIVGLVQRDLDEYDLTMLHLSYLTSSPRE